MSDSNCAYCAEGALVDAFGIKICELAASKVYLFKEQSHRGRVIVASKHHVSELVDLSPAERHAFMDDVVRVAGVLHRVFNPKKVNYGAYGDTGCHLHFHLVPKYADEEFEWGGVFAMNPKRVFLTTSEYADLVAKISAALLLDGCDLRAALQKLKRTISEDGRIDFNESTLLLNVLLPLADSDRRIAELVAELKEVRADVRIDAGESARILASLTRLLA